MAGFLAYMAAGAAQGAGQGIVAEAKARREAAISELEHGRLLAREQASRDFQAAEGEKDRGFRASEGAKDRAASAEQGRLGRQSMTTDADGNAILVDGDRSRQIMGPDGTTPLRGAPTVKDQPADVQTAQWLIQQGVAANATEAYKMVKSAREGVTTPAQIEQMVEKAVDTEFGGSFTPPGQDKIEESRARNRERIMRNLGLTDEPAASSSGGSGSAAPTAMPSNMTATSAVEQAKAAIAAGADPAAVKSRLTSWGVDPAQAGL